jgi:hypothetical protein
MPARLRTVTGTANGTESIKARSSRARAVHDRHGFRFSWKICS